MVQAVEEVSKELGGKQGDLHQANQVESDLLQRLKIINQDSAEGVEENANVNMNDIFKNMKVSFSIMIQLNSFNDIGLEKVDLEKKPDKKAVSDESQLSEDQKRFLNERREKRRKQSQQKMHQEMFQAYQPKDIFQQERPLGIFEKGKFCWKRTLLF